MHARKIPSQSKFSKQEWLESDQESDQDSCMILNYITKIDGGRPLV